MQDFLYRGLFFTLLAGICWGAVGICYSKGTEKGESFYPFMFLSSLAVAGFVWISAPPEAAPRNEILAVSGVMLPSGFAGLFGFLSMKKAMEYGYHGIGWCIVQSAMLCPFLAGMLWFGDRVTLWRTGGMVLLTASLILLGAARQREDAAGGGMGKFIRWISLAFVLVGIQQTLSMFPSKMSGLSGAALTWRVPLYSLTGVIWLFFLFAKGCPPMRPVWKPALVYGGFVCLGQICIYCAIDSLYEANSSGTAYPAACGTCIMLFFIYCMIFRKERLSAGGWAGLALCIAGMACLAL